jgi:alpha-glucosidase
VVDRPWWQSVVIYQIAVPSFADSDGDGRGDIRGIAEHLGYLNDGTADSLGIGAVWLSPIHPSPLQDFGYDVTDHYAINPRLGTSDDFEHLLGACHQRGMRVIMDLALNHTSDQHPWFAESRSSRTHPRRDWYIWRDGRKPGKPPNKWLAVVEGSAWRYDEATGQYYYHAFLPFQPDLNWRNPEVRQEMLGVVRYWLDRGVDGFRLDLINFLYEDRNLRDNPVRLGLRPYLAQRHLHDFSQPESLEVAEQLRDVADEYGDRVLMGEIFSDRPEDSVAYVGDGTDRLHLAFYLDFLLRKWTAEEYRASVEWLEDHLPPKAWPCYYLNNHDLKRTYSRLGGRRHAHDKALVTAAMLLTLRGTPIIYYGEEIGMPTSRVPRDKLDDPIGKRFWPLKVGRDGSRTPMQWDSTRHAGFTRGEPWLPVDPCCRDRNVERLSEDERSLLSWYRRLIHVRNERAELHAGSYRTLGDVSRGVYGYVREASDSSILVLLNFTRRRVRAVHVETGDDVWRVLLSTRRAEGTTERLAEIELAPYEASLFEAV